MCILKFPTWLVMPILSYYLKAKSRWSFFLLKCLYHWRKFKQIPSKLGLIFSSCKCVAAAHVKKSSCVVWGDERWEWVFWELISNTWEHLGHGFQLTLESELIYYQTSGDGMKTSLIYIYRWTANQQICVENGFFVLFWS